ncbi:MAG: CYTH domain-containing protein [Muribaculaceae bacterium]|nr:CYTH domain-containing protein [Muribaculaceae bacterium]
MAFEIEYKYLVENDGYKVRATDVCRISQGYLCRDPERTVRVRIKDDKGFLTVKGKNHGAIRFEFEYEIGLEDAEKMLQMCVAPILEKTRYIVPFDGHIWEVDEFSGCKAGLVTAEIELTSEDEVYSIPDFIGENVTGNPAYYNSNL